jgi:NADH-quinone oxidoreductase subunit A
MFFEYSFIFEYFFIALIIAMLLFLGSFILVYQLPNSEKLSVYECGFNPYGDARNKFEVRFYLVGILFIIFDLELMFLFPWVLSLQYTSFLGIYGMLVFIIILTCGFVYEWVSGALDWE